MIRLKGEIERPGYMWVQRTFLPSWNRPGMATSSTVVPLTTY